MKLPGLEEMRCADQGCINDERTAQMCEDGQLNGCVVPQEVLEQDEVRQRKLYDPYSLDILS